MIDHFGCSNFKALRKFNIQFRTQLTVIAGPNGSGKTTICQALATTGRLVSESPQIVMDELSPNDWELIKNKWETQNNPYFTTAVSGDNRNAMWGIGLIKDDKWDVFNELVVYSDDPSTEMLMDVLKNNIKIKQYNPETKDWIFALIRRKNNIKIKQYNPETKEWEAEVEEIKKLPSYLSTVVEETKHLYPEMWLLKENIKIKYIPFLDPIHLRRKTNQPGLGDTGQNFAYFLKNFMEKNPDKFKEVIAKLKEFFPLLEDISTKTEEFGLTEVQTEIKPEPGEDNAIFRSWQINDGLLRLLALATIPFAEPDLKMLVFEEPENGIHPKLIGATVELLRSFTNMQVVLTTHSPLLLNYLKPEEVVVLVPQGKKGPVAVPFTELDKAEERLEYFDVGDILFHENEWELAKPYLEKLKVQQGKGDKKTK